MSAINQSVLDYWIPPVTPHTDHWPPRDWSMNSHRTHYQDIAWEFLLSTVTKYPWLHAKDM